MFYFFFVQKDKAVSASCSEVADEIGCLLTDAHRELVFPVSLQL
jgi:hypothetical protein